MTGRSHPRMNTSVHPAEWNSWQGIARRPALLEHTDLIHIREILRLIGDGVDR